MTREAAVETRALTRDFGRVDEAVRAVDALDLQVGAGEVVGLLGHNGAGKTTTVRLLNGILAPTSGSARVLGLDPAVDGAAVRARTGVLTETPALDDRLDARTTLSFHGRMFGLTRTEADARADALLETFGLAERADDRVGSYSKGMRQRLALARTLLHDPQLLFLDEPTAGLDPLVQQAFNELLFEARADGRTVFLSSHIISEVERTCDRVAIIREGRIVRLDTVEGVRALAAHEVELRFAAPVSAAPFESLDGVSNLVAEGRTLRMLVTGPIAPIVRLAGQHELVDFVSREPSLEEVFLSEYAAQGAGPPPGAGRRPAEG